jgi:hypothetical protein
MATNTYVALDKVTVGTATSTITFTGINQGYTDLVLVYQGATAAAANMFVRVGNGSLDTGSNYSLSQMVGSGTSASSSRLTSQAEIKITEGIFVNTNEQCNILMNFQNYSNTTTNKTLLSRANSAAIGVQAQVSLWRSTSAINTISVYASQNFNTGTTISLYGIQAASVGAKATGGTVYSDDLYYYHVFGSTGTFTPLSSLTADVLVVAGGGGGGVDNGGAGGAGGLSYQSARSLTATGYSITIGAGGAAGTSAGTKRGSNGSNSVFDTITSNGGGGGGEGTVAGVTGGSGGAGGYGASGGAANQGNTGGATGFGFAGGASSGSSPYACGGGGGAGAIGATGSGTTAGVGGIGASAYSSWGVATGMGESVSGTYYFAGGGGGSIAGANAGGLGGSGGGGKGSGNSLPAVNALANTGGGGGGGVTSPGTAASAGGSGLVIVRYAK